ncbi:hypothetical protein [Rhizobacter sp. SG703]|uniref:hypothetical protein n=1 Tax=Rhizobacter sp. SG703 TaxID=2587140 RepID=UPI00144807EB|nr:hypothetical protein [Rhizobacter sp. SG703]NKI96630.1 hypothetical protein [Rhizobacter sp. SG703]
MTGFCELPDGSPAKPLLASIVHVGDLMAEHPDLLPPVFADAFFRSLCAAAQLLLRAELASAAAARAAVAGQTGRPDANG